MGIDSSQFEIMDTTLCRYSTAVSRAAVISSVRNAILIKSLLRCGRDVER
jgi:hypothetical protein